MAVAAGEVEVTITFKFKNRLRELRERSRLTQNELARLAGIDLTTVNRHENGSRMISRAMMLKYAKVFKVITLELFVDYKNLIVPTDAEDNIAYGDIMAQIGGKAVDVDHGYSLFEQAIFHGLKNNDLEIEGGE